jgi:hypothetical protein
MCSTPVKVLAEGKCRACPEDAERIGATDGSRSRSTYDSSKGRIELAANQTAGGPGIQTVLQAQRHEAKRVLRYLRNLKNRPVIVGPSSANGGGSRVRRKGVVHRPWFRRFPVKELRAKFFPHVRTTEIGSFLVQISEAVPSTASWRPETPEQKNPLPSGRFSRSRAARCPQ